MVTYIILQNCKLELKNRFQLLRAYILRLSTKNLITLIQSFINNWENIHQMIFTQENIHQVKDIISYMKYVTLFLTFFAYASVHILRMSYSSIKPYFQTTFQLSSVFLGLFDGLIYISLGMGFLFRYLIEGQMKRTKLYLIFGITTSCAYMVIPLMSLIMTNSQGNIGDQSEFVRYVIPGLTLIVYGFCQFTAWPILLFLVNQKFNLQKDGTILGLWSANGDVGNILGFLLFSLIHNALGFEWQYVMITVGIIYFIFAFLVSFTFRNQVPSNQQQQKFITQQGGPSPSRKQKFYQFLAFAKDVCSKPQNVMYLMAMAFLKSILYGFLLWMPTYLSHQNHKELSVYAPTVFNVCTVFGSALLGYFYKQRAPVNEDQYKQLSSSKKCFHKLHQNMKSYSLFYSCLFICFCFAIFMSTETNAAVTMFLSGLCGFFLGGAFNMLAGNEVMSITGGIEEKTEMLSTLSMFTGNVGVGIVQIVIGLALNVKKDFSKEVHLFIVLLTVGGIAALTLLIRSTILYKKRKSSKKNTEPMTADSIVSQN